MIQTTAVIVGGGAAGLAMSRRLTERSIDHVVLERGEVANSWRTQRWPSLRLLTPNWQTRLPGHDYAGDDPDGFMPVADVVAALTDYARRVGAPVRTATTVRSLRAVPRGFHIQANDDLLRARAVVLATGACIRPAIPGVAGAVPPSITTLTPLTYRDPGQLPDGGVLVVGASATGVQLAGEIHRSGRPVTLAAGEHVRLPRGYRGRDIFWWLEATGLLAERHDQIDDLTRARHLPSPQLTGTPEAVTTDLNTLTALGIRIVGRLGRITDGVAQFSGALPNTCVLADLKMNRFLNRADEWATASGLDGEFPAPYRFAPTRVDPRSPLELDLTSGEITTVLWATGFRPDHSWLDIPVRDRNGRIRHDGGVVTGAPGLYLLGMPVLRTRASTYIHGAGADTDALAGHLHSFLGSPRRDFPAGRAEPAAASTAAGSLGLAGFQNELIPVGPYLASAGDGYGVPADDVDLCFPGLPVVVKGLEDETLIRGPAVPGDNLRLAVTPVHLPGERAGLGVAGVNAVHHELRIAARARRGFSADDADPVAGDAQRQVSARGAGTRNRRRERWLRGAQKGGQRHHRHPHSC
jgi:putative flavoprotein involved in K+ transport